MTLNNVHAFPSRKWFYLENQLFRRRWIIAGEEDNPAGINGQSPHKFGLPRVKSKTGASRKSWHTHKTIIVILYCFDIFQVCIKSISLYRKGHETYCILYKCSKSENWLIVNYIRDYTRISTFCVFVMNFFFNEHLLYW